MLSDHNNIWQRHARDIDAFNEIDISSCGDTKGCYWEPQDCVYGTNCDVLVTWKDNGDYFIFETDYFIATPLGDSFWSAVGFSYDKNMVLCHY